MNNQLIYFTDNDMCEFNKPACEHFIKTRLVELYKSFMNIDVFPNINVDFSNNNTMGLTFGEVDMKKSTYSEFYLKLNYDMFRSDARCLLPSLFHEFTHVLDESTICPYFSLDEKKGVTTVYTEFHATVVEHKAATKLFNSPNSRLTIQDKIIRPESTVTIQQYYQAELSHWTRTLKEIQLPLKPVQYSEIKFRALYYIGKIYFLKKFVDGYTDQMYNFSIFADILGEEALQIYDLLINSEYSEKLVIELFKLERKMMIKHMNLADEKL